MAEEPKSKRQQVADQCRVVAHLATALAQVHADKSRLVLEAKLYADEQLLEFIGRGTARIMEELGNILNGMDAVEPEDEWTYPIFKEAQRLWPNTTA